MLFLSLGWLLPRSAVMSSQRSDFGGCRKKLIVVPESEFEGQPRE